MHPPFAWLVRGVLAGGCHPLHSGGLAGLIGELRREGIGAIVSVYETELPRAEIARFGLRYLFQPTPNGAAPPDLAAICAFIDEARAARTGALVHCWAGWGRTGTALGAYLVHTGASLSAEEALRAVRSRYDANAIESAEQEAALAAFAMRRAKSGAE